ncbi:uncharacterized protein [Nicotiana tomentosiformis]|uniref:uncharacterized protein n=1 Tax=Nicotiana tomentosiformis TaxID=4098 RepID=UPI00388C8877
MEILRRSFITQTELVGGVNIAHFNSKTVYIDLDNEYDHVTIWNKQYMYIQGKMMKIEAWSLLFNPNEDSLIVPVRVVIPELPWHFYYMEILTPPLSSVGKALFLDLASFSKTRGSVAKVKMHIDLTKKRPSHVWLGFDEDQDVNGNGKWLEVQYESVPDYCLYCKHIGHLSHTCPKKLNDKEIKKRTGAFMASKEMSLEEEEGPSSGQTVPKQLNLSKQYQRPEQNNDKSNNQINNEQVGEVHQNAGADPSNKN